jgi:mannose-6-phosphate isomerase-like protein (cupin superfamily)
MVSIDGVASEIGKDDAIIVPAGALHKIVNTAATALRLYTVYAPPRHLDGFVAKTHALADMCAGKFEATVSE